MRAKIETDPEDCINIDEKKIVKTINKTSIDTISSDLMEEPSPGSERVEQSIPTTKLVSSKEAKSAVKLLKCFLRWHTKGDAMFDLIAQAENKLWEMIPYILAKGTYIRIHDFFTPAE